MASIDRPWHEFSEMLDVVSVVHEKKIETLENLALQLGHKTSNSGGFNMKVASLSKYGLVDRSKGKVRLTPLALKILMPVGGEREKYEGCREAILRVPLLKRLYERLDGKEVREDELWGHLYEISGDREASVQEAAAVFRIYRDALTYLRKAEQISPAGAKAFEPPTQTPAGRYVVSEPDLSAPVESAMIRLQSGTTILQLPRTKPNIDLMVAALTAMKNAIDEEAKALEQARERERGKSLETFFGGSSLLGATEGAPKPGETAEAASSPKTRPRST